MLAASLTGASCKSSSSGGEGGATCTTLFGSPNAATGLGPDQCQPRCGCGEDVFIPPTYDAAFIQSLTTDFTLSTPYPPLTSDPYAGPAPEPDPDGTVCGVLEDSSSGTTPRPYTLVTYPSQDAASAAGARVTHFGHCGVCSTLANLAVYMRNPDLTAPVRACGLQPASTDGGNADVACLEQLGFDLPCAQIWAYDTTNTRSACLSPCLADLTAPYNELDGAINDCLECDEVESGPVFQSIAGRTRRNSGVPNAICRPCSQVQPLVHQY